MLKLNILTIPRVKIFYKNQQHIIVMHSQCNTRKNRLIKFNNFHIGVNKIYFIVGEREGFKIFRLETLVINYQPLHMHYTPVQRLFLFITFNFFYVFIQFLSGEYNEYVCFFVSLLNFSIFFYVFSCSSQSCRYRFGGRFDLAIGMICFSTGQYQRFVYIYICLFIKIYNLLRIFQIISPY